MMVARIVWRYAFSRSNRHRNASMVIFMGIAIGMLAILVILGLMNNLQYGLLDQLRSIQTFHVDIDPNSYISDTTLLQQMTSKLEQLPGIERVVPYIDSVALIRNSSSRKSSSVRVRALPSDLLIEHTPFSEHVAVLAGETPAGSGIAMGYSFATTLGVRLGTKLELTILRRGRTATLVPHTFEVVNNGYFRSGLPEFDSGTILADIEEFIPILGIEGLHIGLYLENSIIENPAELIQQLSLMFPEIVCSSWQEMNQAFYSALILEKILMYVFLFFMFVILGVNIRNSASRLLHCKMGEMAVMRAMGMQLWVVHSIFILQSVLIVFLGVCVGIIGALVLAGNISDIFSIINTIQSAFSGISSPLLAYPFQLSIDLSETAIITAAVLILSVLFSWSGCRKYFTREPMENLDNV